MRSLPYARLLALSLGLTLLLSCRAETPGNDLVRLDQLDAGFVFDLRYATPNNFTKETLYPIARAWLRPAPAQALAAVQKDLKAMGLGLKIYDAYRPLSVQWKMWDLIQDERYVSNPSKNAGRHTRGTAVDVALVDSSGRDLPMPSGFDDFSERAHGDYAGATPEEAKNRALLKEVMEKHGFTVLPTEWWHFDFKDWKTYPPMDIPLDALEKSHP